MEDTASRIVPGVSVSTFMLVSTLLFGGVLLAICYIVSRLSRSNKSTDSTKNAIESQTKLVETSGSTATTGTSGKRAKNKKRREAQQEFSHPWMVGALKGHTAPVLDMNFSSNGKFLASCAEDCSLRMEDVLEEPTLFTDLTETRPWPGTKSRSPSSAQSTSGATSTSSSTTSSTTSSPSSKEDRAILSRRQRKNRTRVPRDQRRELREDEDEQPTRQQVHHHRHHHQQHYRNESHEVESSRRDSRRNQTENSNHIKETDNNTKNSIEENKPVHIRPDLPLMTLRDLFSFMISYILPFDQMILYGYPLQRLNGVFVFNPYSNPKSQGRRHHLDANAREFVPGSNIWSMENEEDSGNGSGSSENSDLEADSDKNSENGESPAKEEPRRNSKPSQDLPRNCARCNSVFYVNSNTGEYLNSEPCMYHSGRSQSHYVDGFHVELWDCCHAYKHAGGCVAADTHVWTGLVPGLNGPFDGFVYTSPLLTPPKDGFYGLYGLDCEMCFTKNGLELTRVTVVDVYGKIVYDTLVKPEAEIIDYNTKFSGITEEKLASTSKTIWDVQRDLCSFIHSQTILVGHGLENDLRALRIVHPTVIDTRIVYRNPNAGPPFQKLSTLAWTMLGKEIQVNSHDSKEDASVAVELLFHKMKMDLPLSFGRSAAS